MNCVPPTYHRFIDLSVFCLVLAMTWLAYAPGLHGNFLFDDFGNLPILGATGPVDNWPAFWRYITAGVADPTGRPLTLLTFLLDANNWPADPYPFIRTGLILHLLNGALLAMLLQQLGFTVFGRVAPRRIRMAAVLGSAFWLLHPLFVSTTLYIVQREAMLPATFTLLGLLLWLRGRNTLQCGHTMGGLTWIVLGLGGCTLLSVLSKANGILLPALMLVIEYVLLPRPYKRVSRTSECASIQAHTADTARASVNAASATTQRSHLDMRLPQGIAAAQERQRHAYRWAMGIFGWVPTALVTAYLLHSGWNGFVHGVSALRPWTMGQRLLTEPRVLMQYLDELWLPRPFTSGLFNDQIKASLSLWSPITTLPSLLAIWGLIVGAWLLRRRWPAPALAILFYFVGQSLESTTIPLELYFEHRNYLPAMLMFWPIALWLCGVQGGPLADDTAAASSAISVRAFPARAAPQWTNLAKGMLAAVLLLGSGLMTHARAQLWGNTRDQGVLWATLNPDSPRAQANAALLEMAAGQPQPAITRLETLLRAEPDQVQLAFNLIGAHCMLGTLGPNDIERARYAISHARDPGSLLVHWFEGSISTTVSGACRNLDLDSLDSLLDAGLANHSLMEIKGRHQDLLYLKGRIALTRHDSVTALRDFNAALDEDVHPGIALEQAALLGSAGYPTRGLAHLDYFESIRHRQVQPGFGMPWLHDMVLQYQHYWPKEIAHLRDTLQQDAITEAPHDR